MLETSISIGVTDFNFDNSFPQQQNMGGGGMGKPNSMVAQHIMQQQQPSQRQLPGMEMAWNRYPNAQGQGQRNPQMPNAQQAGNYNKKITQIILVWPYGHAITRC